MYRGRNRRSSKRELKSEINIVPFLDVLLVLLLIFMATAPVISQSVEVDLPDSTDSSTIDTTENPPVIIEVAGVNQYTIIVDQQRHENLPTQQLIIEAQEIINSNPKAIFLIGGAKQVEYNEIIGALNLLREAGVNKVGLMTQPI